MAELSAAQKRVAAQVYEIGIANGLSPQHAEELVAAAYMESKLDPNRDNASSGAAGLFQLLSSGYRKKAQELGGLHDVRANTLAILPSYKTYWHSHPNPQPGAAAAAVEASGQPASWYASPLATIKSALASVKASVTDILRPSGSANLNGVDPSLLGRLYGLGLYLGKQIDIFSGYRSDAYSAAVGGFAGDPHTKGIAADATIGGKPIGQVVPQATLAKFGLVSGNQPNFYKGQPDPSHVQLVDSARTPGFKPTAQLASSGGPSGWAQRTNNWFASFDWGGFFDPRNLLPGHGGATDKAADVIGSFTWQPLFSWFKDEAGPVVGYAVVYTLLVLFSIVLATIGILRLLGIKFGTVVSSTVGAGAKYAAGAAA